MAPSDKELKTGIMEALKEREDRTLSMKKLIKKVIGDDKSLKAKVESLVDELHLQGKVSVDGDNNVTKVSKSGGTSEGPIMGSKRGRNETDYNLADSKEEYKKKVLEVGDKIKYFKEEQEKQRKTQQFDKNELWRTGEQAWVSKKSCSIDAFNSVYYFFIIS